MANYLSIPILDEFIQLVEEDSNYEDNVKALLNGLLSFCFPITQGYGVAYGQNRQGMLLDFTIYQLQRRFQGDGGVVDRAFVQAKRPDEKLSATRDQLVNALEGANTEHGRCWAIISIGIQLSFYEYHAHLPEENRLVDWCPPGQSTNSFHLRQDVRIIQWMFDYMKANTEPPVLV